MSLVTRVWQSTALFFTGRAARSELAFAMFSSSGVAQGSR